MAHARVVDVVSVPAKNRSPTTAASCFSKEHITSYHVELLLHFAIIIGI